jgi:ribonuclease J
MSDDKQNKTGGKRGGGAKDGRSHLKQPAAAKPPPKGGRGRSRFGATASSTPQAMEQIVSLVSNPLAQGMHKPSGPISHLTSSREFKLKIIPLGGLGEIGKNMTIIQYGEQMIVIDAGVMFPEDELFGIDMVIPDYSYLVENRDKALAFILTHGHEDHIGALPYVLRDVDVPVYGSPLTLGLVKGKLTEFRQPAKLITVTPRQEIDIGPFRVEFIHVTHSIPDSFALAIHTPVGVVLFASDFKMDLSPIDGQMMDFGRLSALGERGVLLLLADSTNVEKTGFTPSEKTVGGAFDNIFLNAPGRIFVTSFASNVHRIQQAIWAASRIGRKIAIVGRGMQNVTTVAKELGYLDLPEDLLIDIDRINDLPANKVLVLTTGSQGEPLSGLTRMASGEHRQVHIVPGDTVVISASPVPGNERLVGRTIDKLFRQGATVIYEKGDGIHVSGHASREELKLLHNIIKPRFFMPVHGEYRMLVKHAKLAQQLGMAEENTFVLENGQVLEVSRRRCRVNGQVPSGRVLIDGLGVGDVGNTVLKERRILSESGILLMYMVFTRKKDVRILAGPEIFSRGFIFEKDYEHIIDEIKEKVADLCTMENLTEGSTYDLSNRVRTTLARFLLERTGRRPVILPIITEV